MTKCSHLNSDYIYNLNFYDNVTEPDDTDSDSFDDASMNDDPQDDNIMNREHNWLLQSKCLLDFRTQIQSNVPQLQLHHLRYSSTIMAQMWNNEVYHKENK